MSENTQRPTTESTNTLGNKPSSTTRKAIAVRSTRTPNTPFFGESSPSTSTSTRTRTEAAGGDKPLNRVQTAPTRPAGHSSTAKTTPPRRQQTTDLPLSITQSHSSDSQAFLTPHDTQPRPTLQFQTQNQRESIASSSQTEPSSYYSADDSFHASLIDQEVPPMPNPHPLSTSATGSKQTLSNVQTPSTSASEQTVIPTQESGLAYRISARTTASTSTRTTGRSSSTSASVMEPSRQSTSDSEAYPRGNGIGGPAPASKTKAAEGGGEDELATLVAGLEELVEDPELDQEELEWNAKGKMKMPEPQYFGTRLSTTQEEDEDIYGDYQDDRGERTMRMPEPFTHSRDQSSSTSQTLHAPTFSGEPSYFSTGATVRKVSPLIIPPTPKLPPPVPLPIRADKQASVGGGHGNLSSSTESKPQQDEDRTQGTSHPLRTGPSNPNTGGSAPLRPQRHSQRPSSAGREGMSSTENASQQQYGTATITGMASSRIERPERPGSSGGLTAPARTSITTTSMNVSGIGRVKTDSTTRRPSIDAHPYAHGRTTSTVSASGASRPIDMRMSGGSSRLPPLPKQGKEKPSVSASASAAVAAATIPHPSRLPPGVSSQMDTQYVNMLLALDDIPAMHNFAVAFFNWIYLAGFVLFPGTFTSLKNLGADQGNAVAADLIKTVTQLPLFIVAWICVGIGATGMLWMLWRWRRNYVWALNKIWLPGLLNSLAGLLSTIASIYGAQHGQFSPTSKATLTLTGLSSAVFAVLSAFYMFWLVRRVKQRHDREVGMQRAGKYGEGVVDVSTRG